MAVVKRVASPQAQIGVVCDSSFFRIKEDVNGRTQQVFSQSPTGMPNIKSCTCAPELVL
jgi:hypothetical protein